MTLSRCPMSNLCHPFRLSSFNPSVLLSRYVASPLNIKSTCVSLSRELIGYWSPPLSFTAQNPFLNQISSIACPMSNLSSIQVFPFRPFFVENCQQVVSFPSMAFSGFHLFGCFARNLFQVVVHRCGRRFFRGCLARSVRPGGCAVGAEFPGVSLLPAARAGPVRGRSGRCAVGAEIPAVPFLPAARAGPCRAFCGCAVQAERQDQHQYRCQYQDLLHCC